MTELVTVGWLTLDDIALADGTRDMNVVGGGALYSAIGARIWHDSVGIHSAAGQAQLDHVRSEIGAWDIDTSGIAAHAGAGLQLWILHESETAKQQIPKLASSGAIEMDAARGPLPRVYEAARAFHLAPHGSASTLADIAGLSALPARPTVTLDLLADEYVDPRPYRDLDFLAGVDAFLPSDVEIGRIWAPSDLEAWLAEIAGTRGCHAVAKLGDAGSLVCEAGGNALHRVPAFPARVLDTTGAGDAYCGGFLAGLAQDRPAAECAAMGTVSASFVVEARGALATARPDAPERDRRLADVLRRTQTRLARSPERA